MEDSTQVQCQHTEADVALRVVLVTVVDRSQPEVLLEDTECVLNDIEHPIGLNDFLGGQVLRTGL